MKQVSFILLLSILAFSCKQKAKNSFVVNVHYENLDKMKGFELENGINKADSIKPGQTPRILLEAIPYGEVPKQDVILPERIRHPDYARGPIPREMKVKSVY